MLEAARCAPLDSSVSFSAEMDLVGGGGRAPLSSFLKSAELLLCEFGWYRGSMLSSLVWDEGIFYVVQKPSRRRNTFRTAKKRLL